MIRINLLPSKKSRTTEKGQKMILLAVLVLGAAGAGMFLVTSSLSDDVAKKKQEFSNLNARRVELTTETKEYANYEAEKQDLLTKQAAIEALRGARQTPTWALDELSQILQKDRRPPTATHPGSGPTMTKEMKARVEQNKNAQWSEGWDAKKLWLTSLTEEKDHELVIEGGAQSDKDVTQFAKRLQASVYFRDVVPVSGAMKNHPTLNIPYYVWTIRTKVLY